MHAIPLGAKGIFTLVVAPEHLANRFKDAMLPPVLATPIMVLVMENAALNAVRAYLEPGESALGTVVDIRHFAATPVGQQVTAEAEVTEVDGRRIVFAVTARDEVEEIGRGSHERMVIDLRRLTQRLAAKSGDDRAAETTCAHARPRGSKRSQFGDIVFRSLSGRAVSGGKKIPFQTRLDLMRRRMPHAYCVLARRSKQCPCADSKEHRHHKAPPDQPQSLITHGGTIV